MKLKQMKTIEETAALLKSHSNIALFAHTRPDGDTIGSCVALSLILEKLGKNVSIFCDDVLDGAFPKFEETKRISRQFSGKYDLLVAVDCSDVLRVGEFATMYDNFAETLVIDHHGGEPFSKYNCLYQYACCCQIIYEIGLALGVTFDETIATYLYMGLCTDTGNFANTNTDKASFQMAGDLCEKGANMQKIVRLFFREMTLAEEKLIARSLSNVRSYFDDKLVIVYAMQKDLDELGLPLSATASLVSYAIDVDTAVCGVSLTEYSDNTYKVSMRGKDFNVRDICRQFGGNGHIVAAGCMISGLFEDVIEKIVRAVGNEL